jgi:photosystem II stability/assembly factor-like uncharacterized protein
MLISTETQVFSLDEEKKGTPQLRFDAVSTRCLAQGARYGCLGLEGGTLVLLNGGTDQQIDSGIAEPLECMLLLNEEPLELLIGTEGPHIYRLNATGMVTRLERFEALECREGWYTPWGGPAAVRSLACAGDWVYADIHVGSIMRSPDFGGSWEPVMPQLHEDVHQVVTVAQAPDRVYANTANAVYLSDDRGASWVHRSAGLPQRYGRALAVHPQAPDCLLASVSSGPHGGADGCLFRSEDAGHTWHHVQTGFPTTTEENIDTFQLAYDATGTAWCVVGDTLYRSDDRGREWVVHWTSPASLKMLS